MRITFTTLLCIYALCCFSQDVSESEPYIQKLFDGPYIGLNIGTQNVFGGSFVNEMDILAQESKVVTEATLGYRFQFLKKRLVAGAEFSIGLFNGNLEFSDEMEPLTIKYDTSFQTSLGGIIGFVIGKKRQYMVFGYLNETTRKFDVAIEQPPFSFTQQDVQGMLKYGLGLEIMLVKNINLDIAFGGLRVDFGDVETNIDVEDKYDFTIGVNCQF